MFIIKILTISQDQIKDGKNITNLFYFVSLTAHIQRKKAKNGLVIEDFAIISNK